MSPRLDICYIFIMMIQFMQLILELEGNTETSPDHLAYGLIAYVY